MTFYLITAYIALFLTAYNNIDLFSLRNQIFNKLIKAISIILFTVPGRLHPGECKRIKIIFLPNDLGLFKERWRLLTEPQLAGLSTFQVEFFGTSYAPHMTFNISKTEVMHFRITFDI